MVALSKVIVGALLLSLVVAGCGGRAVRWEERVHIVRAGEALHTIAFRYRLDQTDLAAWNRLDNPDLIFPGQKLRLTPPPGFRPDSARPVAKQPQSAANRDTGTASSAPAAAPQSALAPAWKWPASGELLVRFGAATSLGQGIDIGGHKGDFIFAAAAGSVVYSGSGLLGYGKLIILKHNETYLSAYGHNEMLLVREGDTVTAGQRIGKMGIGPGDRALLHFEIRMRGKPVDPMQYLPAR